MTPVEWAIIGSVAYLLVGFVITVILGRMEFFDYRATPGQFEPGTLKYMVLLFWVVFVLMIAFDVLFHAPGWLNDKYNDLVNVRRFK